MGWDPGSTRKVLNLSQRSTCMKVWRPLVGWLGAGVRVRSKQPTHTQRKRFTVHNENISPRKPLAATCRPLPLDIAPDPYPFCFSLKNPHFGPSFEEPCGKRFWRRVAERDFRDPARSRPFFSYVNIGRINKMPQFCRIRVLNYRW